MPIITAVRLGRLGDLVMTWPALATLDDCLLQVVVDTRYVRLVQAALPGASVVDSTDDLRPADAVLDLHGVAASRRVLRDVPRLSGAPTFRTPKDSLRRRALLLPGSWAPTRSWPRRHAEAVAALRARLELPTRVAEAPSLDPGAVRPEAGLLGLVVGAGHATKRWPAERFADLSRRWAHFGGRVRVFVGPGEADLAEPVLATETARRWEESTDRPLLDLARGLAGCEVVVGGDTGPLHVAGALGRPVVALFGPTPVHAGFWVWGDAGRALSTGADCAPCSMHGARPCRRPRRVCLEDLPADVVLRAARAQAGHPE